MKTKNIIIYIIICLIIIAGIAVWDAQGFNTELQYSSRYQIQLSNKTGVEISDIETIADEVLGETNYSIQEVEIFGNSVAIIAEEITEDQRDEIVEKFNELYDYDLSASSVDITYIPFTRVKDVIKPYIIPGILSLAIVLAYFLIRFRKINWKEVTLKTLLIPVIAELLMYSIMAIIRIPFGRIAIALSVNMYFIVILILTYMFESKNNKYLEVLKSNDRKES